MSYANVDIQTYQMTNIDQTFHNMSQMQETENDESYLTDNKSENNVDYVFKDDQQSDIEEDLHDKSLLSNSSEYDADTSTSNLIDEIEFTDGYFKRDLLPMLSKGHEGELCKYLQEIGVLKSSMKCNSETCDTRQSLTWTPSRVVDKYQWLCPKCKKRRSIRENSFFKGIKFIIPIVLRAMQGWCGQHDAGELARSMGLKSYAFRTIYTACRDVSARHMTRLLSENRQMLGGPETVVVLQVWATGTKGAIVPIAALVELKDKKFKYFYQPLRYNQQCMFSENEIERNNNIIVTDSKVSSENQNSERDENMEPAMKKFKSSTDLETENTVDNLNDSGIESLCLNQSVSTPKSRYSIDDKDSNDQSIIKNKSVSSDSTELNDTNTQSLNLNKSPKKINSVDSLTDIQSINKPVSINNTVDVSNETNTLNSKSVSGQKPKYSRSKQAKDLSGDLQSLIRQKVASGSFLVLADGVSNNVAINLMKTEFDLKSVKTLDMLRSVENETNPITDIIDLIMQHPSRVVSKAREIPRGQLQKFLMMHLWYDTYSSSTNSSSTGDQNSTLETLLHQIAADDFSNEREDPETPTGGGNETTLRFVD